MFLTTDPVGEKTQILARMHQLEQSTGLSLEVVELDWSFNGRWLPGTAPPIPLDLLNSSQKAPWKPQFRQEDLVVTFAVAFAPKLGVVGRKRVASAAEAELLRRLFTVAVRQLDADEQVQQKDHELECLVSHVTHLYEQVHGIFQVSRSLSLSEPFEQILSIIEQSSVATLAAECVCLLRSSADGTSGPLPDQFRSVGSEGCGTDGLEVIAGQLRNRIGSPVFLRERDFEPHIIGPVLAVELSQLSQRIWLVARRGPGQPEFGSEEASYLLSISAMLEGHLHNADLYAEKDELLIQFVQSLVNSLDARDHATRGHSQRVAAIGRILAGHLGLPEEDVTRIHTSGLLHDIGKIGISDAVLKKTDPLTQADWEEIKRHPVIGHEILSNLPVLADILPGVRSHHERIDGTGYPDGLAGEEIPLMARILAVADAFDAMLSLRPYRQGLPVEGVEQILREGAGTQWDAEIIDAYFASRESIVARWNRMIREDRTHVRSA
jgi:HD-GYP domain-containing protein (c-di-GMP phosphodiesterase class II)